MNYLKFNFLTLSILILIFSTTIFSQQADSSKQKDSPLHAGSWSMQFSYSRLSFGSFKGGNISAKYHFTDKSALRFGVKLSFKNLKNDGFENIRLKLAGDGPLKDEILSFIKINKNIFII